MSQDISNYSKNRDIPSILGTSKLSPHIAFGEITSETIYSYFNNIKNKAKCLLNTLKIHI